MGQSLGEWLRAAREARGWSVRELSRRSGLSRTYLLALERGWSATTGRPVQPTIKTIRALAKAFEMPEEELARIAMGDTGQQVHGFPVVPIPVLGRIHAGPAAAITEEAVVDWIAIPEREARLGNHFGLVVHGDCMEGGDRPIRDGDYVVVRQQDWCRDGQIAVVIWPGVNEAQLRRVYHKGEHLVLRADNPSYPPEVVKSEEVRIIGVVVYVFYRPNGRPPAREE